MARDVTVRVEGLDNLTRTLKKAGVDIAALKEASRRAGDYVAQAAAAKAPRRSGKLAGSIRPSKLAKGARVSVGRASVPYAGPIHWGWPARGIKANPFISQAAQDTEPTWLAMYFDDLEKALEQVKGA